MVECQCECAAGMGPEAHCKHVAVTLYAIIQADKGIMGTLMCTGRKLCDFLVWTFDDCVNIRIPRGDTFIEEMKETCLQRACSNNC